MHPVVIILLILLSIYSIQMKRWMDQVERGIVSNFKFQVTRFLTVILLIIIMLYARWRFSYEAIAIMCFGMYAGLILISIVNTKTNVLSCRRMTSEYGQGMQYFYYFGTGAMTLMIHVPDSLPEVVILLGFIVSVFYPMFLQKPR